MNAPFLHSNKQWQRVEVRINKNTANVSQNAHPNLALVLLLVFTEEECGKDLLLKGEPVVSHFQAALTSVSKRVLVYNLSRGNEFHLQDDERARKKLISI